MEATEGEKSDFSCTKSDTPDTKLIPESSHVTPSTSLEPPPTSHAPSRSHALLVSPIQQRNPLMKHIRSVPWQLGEIEADFVMGRTSCALFLSIKYHSLHPKYVHERIKQLGRLYELRVLLVLVDMLQCTRLLQELAKLALTADLTMIVTWSNEEAAKYLETFKAYENKSPDLIMERSDGDVSQRVIESLTTVKKINKTDAATLMSTFKSLEEVMRASKEDLVLCPGLGEQKAQQLHKLFNEPFILTKKETEVD